MGNDDNDNESNNTKTTTENNWHAWVAICGCSAVALGAHEVDDEATSNWDSANKWVRAGTITTVILGFFAALASRCAAEKFAGTLVEKITAIICLGLWCGLLATIMNPKNDLAQGSEAQGATDLEVRVVRNANLYFFSWGAFCACLYLFAKMSQENTSLSRFSKTPKKMVHWYFVTASSVVVMWSATVYWNDLNTDNFCDRATGDDEETCKRTAYAVFLGAFGTLMGLIALVFSKCNCWPKMVEVICAFVLLCLYIVGVAVLTFKTGPSTVINNLYFASWIGVVWCLYLFLSATQEWRNRNKGGESEEEEGEASASKDMKEQDVKAEEGEAEKPEAPITEEGQEATA